MKNHHSPRGGSLVAGLLASLLTLGSTYAADSIPTGELDVDRTLVRVGTRSELDWKIQYPKVTEIIDIEYPCVIRPKKDLKMRVRVLGASFQESVTKYLPVEVAWGRNTSSWTSIFSGTQNNVKPTTVVLDTTVKKNDRITFSGRGYRSGWLPRYTTSAATANLVMLKNGDKVPTTVPAMQQGNIETFLRPYLLADRKTVSIGERDVIMLMELGQTNPNASGFDLQDLVVLVTFE